MYLKKSTFSGLFWNCLEFRIFDNQPFRLLHFWLTPVWISIYVIKYYFNSVQGKLNNRPSHQVTVGPDWIWMSFSNLPYLLDALWPIIATSDHFPVFRNENESEAGIVPFVVILYLFIVGNQWCIYFKFLLYFFVLLTFTINLTFW